MHNHINQSTCLNQLGPIALYSDSLLEVFVNQHFALIFRLYGGDWISPSKILPIADAF